MKDLTQPQIEKSVSAAFDSVNLIKSLQLKENISNEDASSITRNIEHLKVMMTKDWFKSALSTAQKTQINSLIK